MVSLSGSGSSRLSTGGAGTSIGSMAMGKDGLCAVDGAMGSQRLTKGDES